jgi:hypothetical protein
VTLRAIYNRRNFFSDYWLGSLLGARGSVGPRLTASELRRKMRLLLRLIDGTTGGGHIDAARFRERFARPLLMDVLDFTMHDPEVAPHVYRLSARESPDDAPPIALVYVCNDATDIDRHSVLDALDAELGHAGLDHALILSPEVLRLVRHSGDGPRQGALDVSLATMREHEESESLQVAYRLLSAASFVAGADGRRPIDILEAESRAHSARVSAALKGAVFEAAERLVSAFQWDVTARREAFGDRVPTLAEIRDAGFLALYRLLFILYAESRDARLARHRVYREAYGLEGLIGNLLRSPLDEYPVNRTRLWERLRVLFRVFNEGLSTNLPNLENIPPRGGRLFSDATPEGALLTHLRLDDRACVGVLLAIATTRPRRGIGRERVSFRELEIEQLGSVYEGLLEYEPAIADQLSFAVRVGGRELVLTPDNLLFLCERKKLTVSGDAAWIADTAAARLHPANVPDDAEQDEVVDELDEEDEEDEDSAAERAGQSIRLVRRLEPGTFYFRPGGARKASGSYYTPTPMVDFLVREALGPLVAGRTAAQIEQLRIVDLACGSAHFLVGAARFLGARLHDAYRAEYGGNFPPAFAPGGGAPAVLRTRWADEAPAWCKRRIVERCVYGVDLNPAAVQLAQVALWIESLAGDRPLSFFAHHVRVGNSLQGTFVDRFDTAPDPQLAITGRDSATLGLFESNIRQRIEAALAERRLIDAELPPEIRADTPDEFRYKEDRLRRSDAALTGARLLMDLRSASPYVPAIWPALIDLIAAADVEAAARGKPWWAAFEAVRTRERFFHWELEFPEVLLRADRPGFDAVIGNPPWDKVLPTKREFYSDLDPLVIAVKGHELDQRIRDAHRLHPGLDQRFQAERTRTTTFARVLRKGGDFLLAKPTAEEDEEDGVLLQRRVNDQNAHEDVAKYFVDRSLRLTREGGAIGLVVPAVVYNGNGCVGIRQYLLHDAHVQAFYAFENRQRIFAIDSRYKFANIVVRKEANGAGAFDAAFMRHQIDELTDVKRKPWTVHITRDEIERLSPSTLALLEYRDRRDQDIVRRMSLGRPTLGGDGNGAWGTCLISWRQHEIVYNATEDKNLFTIPGTGHIHTPGSVLGAHVPTDPCVLVEAMRAAGFWPVYEGKHIEQYLYGIKPIRWWLSVEQAKAKYDRPPREAPTLVFRETASNTNQRTCIATVLPRMSATSHKCTAADFTCVRADAALTVLNSLCFDFLLRLRVAGTNVSFTHILPVAVPTADVTNGLPRIPARFARDVGVTHIADAPDVWPELWACDIAVAKAYGLGPQEFAHILQTFPVWQRKRPGIAAFYRARLVEWDDLQST